MRFLKWLQSIWPKRQTILVRVPLRKGMTLSKWRESPDLIRAARQLWKNGVFLDMIAVLENNSPGRGVSIQPPNQVNSLIELGRIRGYEEALLLLKALAEFPTEKPKEIESDWGADQIMKNDNYPESIDPVYDDQQ